MVVAYFDGLCAPVNPNGFGACGCLIKHNNRLILKKGFFIGVGEGMSCNVSEYLGFINLLKFLKKKNFNCENILIRGDSRLVIEQMKGNWKIKHGAYLKFALEAKKLKKGFPHLTLEWIPREENAVCDELAEKAVQKG
jgi:ribonuclease HI